MSSLCYWFEAVVMELHILVLKDIKISVVSIWQAHSSHADWRSVIAVWTDILRKHVVMLTLSLAYGLKNVDNIMNARLSLRCLCVAWHILAMSAVCIVYLSPPLVHLQGIRYADMVMLPFDLSQYVIIRVNNITAKFEHRMIIRSSVIAHFVP